MSDLTVVNRASTTTPGDVKQFSVSVSRNIEITNYNPTQREQFKEGDINAKVGPKKPAEISVVNSDGKIQNNLATMDLSNKRYSIFKQLAALDGKAENLSDEDLSKANKLIGKDGVTNVRRDAAAGVTTFVFDDGSILRFDVETDAEKNATQTSQAYKLDMTDAEALELHKKCRSTFEKVVRWILGTN